MTFGHQGKVDTVGERNSSPHDSQQVVSVEMGGGIVPDLGRMLLFVSV
jgi:hypothetical protein